MTLKYLKVLIIVTLCILILPFRPFEQRASAFSNQVIQQGATGDDVIELQARLQYLGFFTGKIDGVFSWRTYWALRNFQYEFGLPIDGLAGATTKAKLVKASKYNKQYVMNQIAKGKSFTHYGGMDLAKQSKQPANKKSAPVKKPTSKAKTKQSPTNPPSQARTNANPKSKASAAKGATAANVPNGFSQNDIRLMANAVHGESRGEPYIGQVAVASVILNRVQSASFPNTVSGVIFEPGAFTAVADGQIWLTPNETSKKAVLDAINGWDPTGEAIYYFNPDTATSAWIWGRPQIKRIGKHIFCK
ncbi:spore cortex-lytic enzyme [Cytobacillus sp. Hz8]|uniref:spore cortex-lytic enzyme n=1 Tax=Cytobacillus sp. Hz8 TaxID=3347168 RepID=UPI0035D54A3E